MHLHRKQGELQIMPTQKDNARCNRAAPIFNPHGSGGYTPTPKNHETNPIYPSASLAHDPNMRNEPNLRLACHPERRAAERSAAAQSRRICQSTIAEEPALSVQAVSQSVWRQPFFLYYIFLSSHGSYFLVIALSVRLLRVFRL